MDSRQNIVTGSERLRAKHRVLSIISRILIILHAICMSIAVVDTLDLASWGNSSTLIPGLILITLALPLIFWSKRIKTELRKREGI